MFCEWSTTDKIAAIGILVNVVVLTVLIVHAWIFNKQANILVISVLDSKSKEQRELRAYLFPTGKCRIAENTVIGDSRRIKFEAEYMNSGKTPATNVVYKFLEIILNNPGFSGVSIFFEKGYTMIPDVGPGQTVLIHGEQTFSEIEYSRLLEPDVYDRYLYFFGDVKYNDEWGKEYQSRFEFVMVSANNLDDFKSSAEFKVF